MSLLLDMKLVRISEIPDGTFGVFSMDDIPKFVTVEPNWRDNGPNSCIPAGDYICNHYTSAKYPNTLEIIVPGRSKILIHSGNIEDHSLGCIVLGRKFDTLKKVAVLESASAVASFKAIIKNYAAFRLQVIDCTK